LGIAFKTISFFEIKIGDSGELGHCLYSFSIICPLKPGDDVKFFCCEKEQENRM